MKFIQLGLAAITGCLCTVAIAGTGDGAIQRIYVNQAGGNGQGVVMLRTAINNNKALCSTAHGGTEWAFSLERESGKAMYALLLSAQAQQRTIGVVGSGDCTGWSDRERPFYIFLNN